MILGFETEIVGLLVAGVRKMWAIKLAMGIS